MDPRFGLGLFAVLVACGEPEGGELDASAPDASMPDAAMPDAVMLDADIELEVCALGVVFDRDRLEPAEPNSDGYEVPTADRAALLIESLDAVSRGDFPFGELSADGAGYQLCRAEGDPTVIVWRPLDATGQARIALRMEAERELLIEAPHPFHDTNSLDEALTIFEGIGARALIAGGGHRCASAAIGCSGSSTACDRYGPEPHGVYRLSDPAHANNGTFHLAHVALAAAFPESVAINVHGFGSIDEAPDAQVILSNGTTDSLPSDAPVARLAAALGAAGVAGVVSCNAGAGVPEVGSLCGTTNVQGRHLRGSPEACTSSAGEAQQRFVHLEQTRTVRDDLRENVVTALRAAF